MPALADLLAALPDDEFDDVDRAVAGFDAAWADREWLDGRADKSLEALDGRCPEHLRGWEWHYLRRRAVGYGRVVGEHVAVTDRPAEERASSTACWASRSPARTPW